MALEAFVSIHTVILLNAFTPTIAMKNILFFGLLLLCMHTFGQDYLVKKDGTTVKGKMKAFANNTFTIETEEGKQVSYEVAEISKAYMADEHFRMDNISLENATFMTNDGLTILLDNSRTSSNHSNRSYSSSYSEDRSERRSKSTVEHISDSRNHEKGTLVLKCKDCAHQGRLELVSRDGQSSSKISFESEPNTESFFPYTLKLDADRTYDWTYYDKNVGEKTGSIKLDAGETIIFSLDK